MSSKQRIVCAMSGGVDSSMAAALMVEKGYEVIGMTMRLYDAKDHGSKGRGGTCCSPAEVDMARRACERLGIAHYVVDESERFERHVIDNFVDEYLAGRTPNPCARCNQHIKFDPLIERAQALGAEFMVTGHYARIIDGALHRAVDPAKDQSYFLFAMGQRNLSRVRFPLGEWTKEDARVRARELEMPNWNAPDSQELCFVPDGDHAKVVARRAKARGLSVESIQAGEIRDDQGEVLGTHQGIHRVTVGQRRGLGISSRRPRYVLQVLPEERAVIVGDEHSLDRKRVFLRDVSLLSDLPEGESFSVQVQIRHRSSPSPARLQRQGDHACLLFDQEIRAVAPGQAAVFYDGEKVLGGGWITAQPGFEARFE